MNYSVQIHPGDSAAGKVRAYCEVTIDDAFVVNGVKIIDGTNGIFVDMPSVPYTDRNGERKYRQIFHPISREARQEFVDAVMDAYERSVQ